MQLYKDLNHWDYFVVGGVILLLFVDLYVKILPIMPIAMLSFVYMAVRCNYLENALMLIYFYPLALGYTFRHYGIMGMGGLMILLGFSIIYLSTYTKRSEFYHFGISLVPMIVLLAVLTISAFTTEGGDVAMIKLNGTISTAFIQLVLFTLLFSNLDRINVNRLGLFYIFYSAVLLRMSLFIDGIPGPLHIFDFGFLRTQTGLTPENVQNFIGYQNIGFYCAQGLALYMLNNKVEKRLYLIIVIILALFIELYTGSRQAIITYAIIILLWAFTIRNNSIEIRIITYSSVILLIWSVFKIMTAEGGIFNTVYSEGYIEGGGRGPWLLAGIEQFLQKPFFGVGYGRYIIFGEYGSYPHNLFIELLCETGIVGFTIALILASRYLIRFFEEFKIVLYLFIALFARAMASDSLSFNIADFAFIFALPALGEWRKQSEGLEDITEGNHLIEIEPQQT